MINRKLILCLSGLFCLHGIFSCRNSRDQGETAVRAVVPVTVTSPRTGRMTDFTELMATSAYLVKTVIKSPVTGYVEKCSVSPGDKVYRDQLLFQLRTKESAALKHDSIDVMQISGVVTMKAMLDGVVASIDHPQGDFVLEGDALSTLVVPGSLVFLLEVPFEMKSLVRVGQEYKLILPDNRQVNALVKSVLPSMSGASQTQRMVLKPLSVIDLPENLMAKVNIVQNTKNNAVILPKSCILNDEIMKNFWVMKLVSDSVAVKVPVETGISGPDSIEVV